MTRSEELRRTAKGIWPYIVGKIREMLADTTSAITTAITNAMIAGLAEKLDIGAIAYRAASIPFGEVDSGSAGDDMTATVPGVTELRDGILVYISNPVIASKATWTLNVNGLGGKPVCPNTSTTRSTTVFAVNYTMLFIYRESKVEGGCWDIIYGYDSNTNTIAYQIRRNNGTYGAKAAFTRYQILLSYSATHVLPVYSGSYSTGTSKTLTTEDFNPFGPIFYYGSTTAVSANAEIAIGSMWEQYTLDLRYSFNKGSTLVGNKDVFIVASPQSNGRAKLHTSPIAQDYPTTEDGLIYIYLGHAYSTTSIVLAKEHPIYQFKDNKIQLWTGA